MSYCSVCKYQFERKAEICPNCRERLVPVLRERETSASQPDDSWVVVGGVKDKLIGEMAVDTLGSNNIPSMFVPSLSKKDFDQMFDNFILKKNKKESNLIMVPTEYKEEATLVLSDIFGDAFDEKQRKNDWI